MNSLDFWREDRPRSLVSSWGSMSRDLERMVSEMERLFGSQSQNQQMDLMPACDLEETEKEYLITLDIPGVKKEDIQIEVSGNMVNVSAERNREEERKSKGQKRFERHFGRMTRSFQLPEGIKAEDVEASYEQGVLCLTIPKSEERKPRRIEVRGGEAPGGSEQIGAKSSKDVQH